MQSKKRWESVIDQEGGTMSKETQKVSVDILKVHPRNTEFFDDISGQDYEDFKQSIKEDGIISDIIVAPDMTIISGHQRYKAAKELGIKMVPVQIREDLDDEDRKLKILLASNFGRKENSDAKKRKIAVEYVKLCGYKHGEIGRNHLQKGQDGLSEKMNLSEIAKQLNTSERNLKRIMRIDRSLTEETKELLDKGIISMSFAADTLSKLSPTEQEQLISSLDVTKSLTQKEIKRAVDELQSKEEEKIQKEVDKQVKEKLKEYKETKASDPVVNNNPSPTLPSDYEEIKLKNKELEEELQYYMKYKEDYETMVRLHDKKADELNELRKEIKTMENEDEPEDFVEKLRYSALVFCGGVDNFIEKYGGYIWLTDKLNEIPDFERKGYIHAIQTIKAWALQMENNINKCKEYV